MNDSLFKDIPFYKNKRKKGIITISMLGASLVLCLTLSAIFSNYKNYIPQMIVCYVVAITFGWAIIYILFDIVLKNHFFVKKLNSLALAESKEITGRVIKKDKIITTSKYEKAYEIELIDEDKKIYSFSYSLELGECPLLLETIYILKVTNNWIINFKESDRQ